MAIYLVRQSSYSFVADTQPAEPIANYETQEFIVDDSILRASSTFLN
jgi:hypothetical protein